MLEDRENRGGGMNGESLYDEAQNEKRQPPGLGKSQKFAVAALAVFALFVMVMWTIQFKKGLTQPFVYNGSDAVDNTAATACSGPDCPAVQAALKQKDTDRDGLTDYDELYVYKTSPYLEDSDSDGISDAAEIKNSADPNCPEGKTCYQSALTDGQSEAAGTDAVGQDIVNQLQANSSTGSAGTASGSSTPSSLPSGSSSDAAMQSLMSGQIDAASLRQVLIENGMPKATLDQISDDDLMKSFSDSMGQMSQETGN